MTLPTGTNKICAGRKRNAGGFTLVELILVLVLLATMAGFVAPSLSRFFRGQGMGDEAKRFVTLTRFARGEAISKSIPMTVWINSEKGSYGLRVADGFEQEKSEAYEIYRLGEKVEFHVEDPVTNPNDEITITFQADGSIDEKSQSALEFRNTRDEAERIVVALSENRLGYRIWNEDDYIEFRNSR